MDQDLARKRKLQALAGQPEQTSPSSANDSNRTAYYASTNPPSGLPSLASFVSTNAEALSDLGADPEGKVPRPVKKKKTNEGGTEPETSRQRPATVSSGAAASKPGNPATQRPAPGTRVSSAGPSMFPLRRVESNANMNNTRMERVLNDRDNDTDQDEIRDQPTETGKRGRSLSTATNILSVNRNSAKADDEDSEQGYGTSFGGRGREGSVSMHSGTEAGGSGKKGKRNRVHFSCVECHRRKQKVYCDRGEPCGQCIARKVPNLCRPFINGVEDPAVHEADIKARLTRIEDILSSLITRLPATGGTSDVHSENSHGSTSQTNGNPASSNTHLHPQQAQQHHGQNQHGAYHQRPIAPAPPAVSARNRIRSNGSRTPVPASIDDAGNGYQRVDVDVRAMLSGGAGEEVFHPKAHESNSQTSSPAANQTHTPPVPLYYSNVHAAGSPSDGPSPTSGAIIEPPKIKARITLDPPSPELTEILHTLSESGITKNVLISLLMSVPEKSLCDNLVELYFREIDWTRYKINRPAFHRKYNQFFESMKSHPTNPPLNGDMLKWLPLMFIVLAIATLSAPLELVGGMAGQKSWSRRFYGSSRSALTCAKALQRDNLDVLYAGLLTARYMLLTRRAAEGSTPLTAAFQLGLYRDGTVLNLTDKREIELRRRAWAMVYHLDRTTALLVGRPTSISDAHTDTKEPANLDDEEVDTGDFDPKGHSLMHPTEYTQVILRHRLAEIMGRISDHTFAIRPPDYATVLKLDQELLDWQSKLPPFFAIHHPDTSLDSKHHFLFVQRHLLACEFLFARITLHRPYLLRKRTSDKQYQYSRDAAIESAKADLLGRREFMFEKPQNVKINSGGYRVLNSYIVLGVTIKLDAASPRAEELRRLLDVVAGIAPDEQGRISEPIVKDELAIVEFLTQRANNTSVQEQALNNSAPMPPYSHVLSARGSSAAQRFGQQQQQPQQVAQEKVQDGDRQLIPSDPVMQLSSQGGHDGVQPPTHYSGIQQQIPEDSAWSFIAPDLNTIDVHQPFVDNERGLDHRMPGPLRGPARSRQTSLLEQAYTDTARQDGASAEQHSALAAAEQQTGLQGYENQFSNELDLSGSNATNVDSWWNDAFGQLPTNATGVNGDVGFNPFYLSQLGQGSDAMSENSETDFLNILLSTIANNSTLGTGA
ncbi:hypothetical protein QFC22_005380 [Naganishia vaughanmartiniae]|uniref:Uncharacterized protein n=1 Tax=Naganishia vaughanmartiniae TaxID=1424756 RepID=A0ACC2WWZ3_9TREE|nr:hypothetical protein QFC22_005380 [Naganishia vaughanmartiniae]